MMWVPLGLPQVVSVQLSLCTTSWRLGFGIGWRHSGLEHNKDVLPTGLVCIYVQLAFDYYLWYISEAQELGRLLRFYLTGFYRYITRPLWLCPPIRCPCERVL